MTGRYALKKPLWRAIARAADSVGYCFRKSAPKMSLRLNRVLVVRQDQLGDMIQTLPFFDSLKASFPGVIVDFMTTAAGAGLFRLARPDINIVSEKDLADVAYDAVFELRGDIRLICRLRKLRGAKLIGYGSTGGGFLLDVEPLWERDLHAIDKNLRLLEAVGGKIAETAPKIKSNGLSGNGRLAFAIHPDAGTTAKKWPLDRFASVIDRLVAELDANIKLIGLNSEMGAELARLVKSPVDNRMGKTTLPELIDLLGGCDALLTNDSGPAHLMAALGKPVWVAWSGTADPKIWSPRGAKVTLFQHMTRCTPCSRPICNVDGHPCLAEIRADEVASSIISSFQAAGKKT